MSHLAKLHLVILLALASSCFADTCPSVNDLKTGHAPGWKFYDSDDGTLLTEKQTLHYKNIIHKFVLAEWQARAKQIHCYYSDKDGSGLEAYVAKTNFHPAQSSDWYQVTGATQCVVSVEKCRFIANTPQRLAKS